MKNRKLYQLFIASVISATMMTSGISVSAADFSDNTSVAEQSIEAGEEDTPSVDEASEFQSDAAEATTAVAVNPTNFPDAKFRNYILENVDTDRNQCSY